MGQLGTGLARWRQFSQVLAALGVALLLVSSTAVPSRAAGEPQKSVPQKQIAQTQQQIPDCRKAVIASIARFTPNPPRSVIDRLQANFLDPEIQAVAKKAISDAERSADLGSSPLSKFHDALQAQVVSGSPLAIRLASVTSTIRIMTPDEVLSCFPDLRPAMRTWNERAAAAARTAKRKAQERQRQQQEEQAEQAERDRAAGYRAISIETFLLDGKKLASNDAKVSLNGIYTREGRLDVLYADARARYMAAHRGVEHYVPLLTDDAAREFRQHLLKCQAKGACSVTILGSVTICERRDELGAKREIPCIAVHDGRLQLGSIEER